MLGRLLLIALCGLTAARASDDFAAFGQLVQQALTARTAADVCAALQSATRGPAVWQQWCAAAGGGGAGECDAESAHALDRYAVAKLAAGLGCGGGATEDAIPLTCSACKGGVAAMQTLLNAPIVMRGIERSIITEGCDKLEAVMSEQVKLDCASSVRQITPQIIGYIDQLLVGDICALAGACPPAPSSMAEAATQTAAGFDPAEACDIVQQLYSMIPAMVHKADKVCDTISDASLRTSCHYMFEAASPQIIAGVQKMVKAMLAQLPYLSECHPTAGAAQSYSEAEASAPVANCALKADMAMMAEALDAAGSVKAMVERLCVPMEAQYGGICKRLAEDYTGPMLTALGEHVAEAVCAGTVAAAPASMSSSVAKAEPAADGGESTTLSDWECRACVRAVAVAGKLIDSPFPQSAGVWALDTYVCDAITDPIIRTTCFSTDLVFFFAWKTYVNRYLFPYACKSQCNGPSDPADAMLAALGAGGAGAPAANADPNADPTTSTAAPTASTTVAPTTAAPTTAAAGTTPVPFSCKACKGASRLLQLALMNPFTQGAIKYELSQQCDNIKGTDPKAPYIVIRQACKATVSQLTPSLFSWIGEWLVPMICPAIQPGCTGQEPSGMCNLCCSGVEQIQGIVNTPIVMDGVRDSLDTLCLKLGGDLTNMCIAGINQYLPFVFGYVSETLLPEICSVVPAGTTVAATTVAATTTDQPAQVTTTALPTTAGPTAAPGPPCVCEP